MRHSIKEPIPELEAARDALSAAADAHLSGDRARANAALRRANCSVVWSWLNPAWIDVERNLVNLSPEGDTKPIPKSDRDPDRNINAGLKRSVLDRDGFFCRYCGIAVISADIRKFFAKQYSAAVPWDSRDPGKQHAGLQSLWLQFDHVVPHSHGGRSTLENVVVSCAMCNFGKHGFTLQQLGISDPRVRPPTSGNWDGLERLRPLLRTLPDKPVLPSAVRPTPARGAGNVATPGSRQAAASSSLQAFFIPGARLSNGYLLTPPIDGKERWFAIGADVKAEPVARNGVDGFRLVCPPSHLKRRGIKAELLADLDD